MTNNENCMLFCVYAGNMTVSVAAVAAIFRYNLEFLASTLMP